VHDHNTGPWRTSVPLLAVVPTLGTRSDSLERTLRSVSEQDNTDVQIVIVSPRIDERELLQIASRFDADLRKDPGIGLAAALNRGLEAGSEQTTFLWINDDDVLLPGAIDSGQRALDEDPTAVMVYGNIEYVDPEGHHLTTSRLGPSAQWLMTIGPNLVPQPGSIARLEAVAGVGGFDEDLQFALDQDLFLRLRELGPIVHINRTVAQYTWHPDALTVRNRQRSIREAEMVRGRHRGPIGRFFAYPADIATRGIVTLASQRLTRRAQAISAG
jgi:GT2 family glycosyltransferase